MKTITLSIDGITCMGCVHNITGVLTSIAGVSSCDVSKEKAEATIVFDPNLITEEILKEAVEEAGFDVK